MNVVLGGNGGSFVGVELGEELLSQRLEVNILYVSGYTEQVLGKEIVPEAKVGFLQKPFSPAALTHKIREILDA